MYQCIIFNFANNKLIIPFINLNLVEKPAIAKGNKYSEIALKSRSNKPIKFKRSDKFYFITKQFEKEIKPQDVAY